MTSRERVRKALHHQSTDRLPIDLGSTPVTGIAASTYSQLRVALELPAAPVKINEPFQLLAEVEDDVRVKLGVDTVGIWMPNTLFGFRNEGWKPWQLQDGTDVLVSQYFETVTEPGGDVLLYPKGDRSASPSARLPKGGYYFDSIVRQPPLDEDHLDPQDWAEQFTVFTDEELDYLERTTDHYFHETDFALVGDFWQGGLGDIALVPGQMLINPKGIRDPQLWYEFLLTHPDYIQGIFELQTANALKNLELYCQAVGDKIEVVVMSGTDFGTQRCPIISPDMFRQLWKPYYQRLNDWVHEHTPWKIFYHSCGAILPLLDDFVEMGVDILNPVQCSAEGMDPAVLKTKYGKHLVFWGGGVDTQRTLPFGSTEEVRREVTDRLRVFGKHGGFVFNTIHNIQARTPVENVVAMYETVRHFSPT